LPDEDLVALDEAIARGRFPNRTTALREGLASLLREEREAAIEEAYRRSYTERPQEAWIGEAGLGAFSALIEAERPEAKPL